MNYLGDFTLGDRVRFSFNTSSKAGPLITLAGDINGNPAVAVYINGSTTELTAGASIQVNFDGRTGYHLITVDTDNIGYTVSADYRVVITAGVVDGESVANIDLCHFSIQNRSTDAIVIQGAAAAAIDASLTTYRLDHLFVTAVTGADVADNSVLAMLVSKSATADWDTYVNTTDSLEAIKDSGGGSVTIAAGGIVAGSFAPNAISDTAISSAAVTKVQVGLATTGLLATVADFLDTEIAAILAATTALQTDWANGGRLDVILDTAAISGLDAVGIRTALGLGSANLDVQLADLPTVAELAARTIIAANYLQTGVAYIHTSSSTAATATITRA